ncbi:MAG TPA: hypothetical protein PLH98_06055 [Ruminococcus flavefaciens]|nr:hypothetical protein [Ruminococcus flavefaciens]
MRMITLKNADKLQTIEITYDGFNYNGKQIQHGALLIVKETMDFDIGGTDEAIDFIQTAVKENGFSAYDEYSLKIKTLREIVHAVESLEKTCQPKPEPEYPQVFEPVKGQIYTNKNGSDYLCIDVAYNENNIYTRQVEFVSRSGWCLVADCPRQYKDSHIEWDSSYNGHFIELAEAQKLFTEAE